MIYLIYDTALYLGLVVLFPYIAFRLATTAKHRAGFFQKLGYHPKSYESKTIWIHAVSVGEVIAAQGLVREIANRRPDKKIVMTTTTPTGYEVAIKKVSALADVLYFPYDLPFAVRRAVLAINPEIFVTVDTELWPNVIRQCKRHGACVALVNGRISERSYPGYMRFKWFIKHVLGEMDMFLMQGPVDVQRIVEMGADPDKVKLGGVLKFDTAAEPVTDDGKSALRKSLGVGNDEKVVFLGSIHKGEEAAIRSALNARKKRNDIRIVIAPRRIEDIEWIKRALKESGFEVARKTSLPSDPEISINNIVPVLDTFGELAKYYAIADIAFVGGSLMDHGGQNPLEPAAHGIAPLFGPFMSNFRDASQTLLDNNAAWVVQNETEVENMILSLLGDDKMRALAGAAAMKVIEQNSGVTQKMTGRILGLCGGE